MLSYGSYSGKVLLMSKQSKDSRLVVTTSQQFVVLALHGVSKPVLYCRKRHQLQGKFIPNQAAMPKSTSTAQACCHSTARKRSCSLKASPIYVPKLHVLPSHCSVTCGDSPLHAHAPWTPSQYPSYSLLCEQVTIRATICKFGRLK